GGSRALVAKDSKLTEILDTARLGALQMAPVPWTRTRRLLSVSGQDDESLTWATEGLTKRGFDGNVALLQSPTNVNTFKLERLSDEELQRQLQNRFTERQSIIMQMASFVLVGFGAAFVLLVWAFRDRFAVFRWRR